MQENLWLGNVRLLLALNHFTAARPDLYKIALLLSGPIADACALAVFALLWFWPQLKHRRQLQIHAEQRLNPLALAWLNLRTRWAMDTPREQSRAQVIAVLLATALAFIVVRWAAIMLQIERPFFTYLPVREGIKGTFENAGIFGAFAADYAIILAVLSVALFYWDRRLALAWIGLSVVFAIARIATGFNFPLNTIAGATTGVLLTRAAFSLYDRHGSFHANCHALARTFDRKNAPYCFLMYFVLVLVMLEFASRFEHVIDFLLSVQGGFSSR